MTRLPAELTDRVIDFLHSDEPALEACSLVCRNWVPASRHHLFQKLYLNPNRVQTFVELLDSPTSTISKHVLTVDISLSGGLLPGARVFDMILPYLGRFAVRSLDLCHMRWNPISKEQGEEISRCFSGITVLRLIGVTFSCPGHLIELVTSCTSLETLGLCSLTFPFTTDIHSFVLPSQLRTIDLLLFENQPTLSWLISNAQFPAVKKVALYKVVQAESHSVQVLLQTLGPSIHSLDLFFEAVDIEGIRDCVDLTHNSNLRWLTISGIPLYETKCSGDPSARRRIPQIFLQVTTPHLSAVLLHLTAIESDDIDWLDWKQLAHILIQPQFMKLQKVHVVVECTVRGARALHYHTKWVDCVRKGMSILDSHDVLHVRVLCSQTMFPRVSQL